METKYLSTSETAKYIRNALKQNFPTTKFSVRSHVYAGGSSIRVSYFDGPAKDKVNLVAGSFAGATFDGMQDLKEYNKPTEVNGEMISWGADFVFVDRVISHNNQLVLAEEISQEYFSKPFDGNFNTYLGFNNRDDYHAKIWQLSYNRDFGGQNA